MATLTNSPRQLLNFDLERGKSFAFQVRIKHSDGTAADLTGCTLRFVMKAATYDDDTFDTTNILVNSEAVIADPAGGLAAFAFQASELDQEPGEYNAALVLWTAAGYSTLLIKGTVNLLANTEFSSTRLSYAAAVPVTELELSLRAGDTIEVTAATTVKNVSVVTQILDIDTMTDAEISAALGG